MNARPTPIACHVYGIRNCDTVKKARRWLEERNVAYRFHDFRAGGLDRALLERFEATLGWEALLNRKGTTWRQLDADVRENVDRERAFALMLEHPALIKRPVLEQNGEFFLGFDPKNPWPLVL